MSRSFRPTAVAEVGHRSAAEGDLGGRLSFHERFGPLSIVPLDLSMCGMAAPELAIVHIVVRGSARGACAERPRAARPAGALPLTAPAPCSWSDRARHHAPRRASCRPVGYGRAAMCRSLVLAPLAA